MAASVRRRFPAAVEAPPPEGIVRARDAIAALLSGEPHDLREVELDLSGAAPFERRVYDFIRTIPPGSVLTYGEVAARVGEPGAAQAVGAAMGRNPVPIVVPCHRVLAAGGRLHGFSAPGGVATKRRLLAIEGARMGDGPDLFDPRG